MNLMKRINLESTREDLSHLIEEPFEITDRDFSLMFPVTFMIKGRALDKALELSAGFTREQKEIIGEALRYDYSVCFKVFLSYFYHALKKDGFPKKVLEDVKTMNDAILFSTQGIRTYKRFSTPSSKLPGINPPNTVIPTIIPLNICKEIWAEFSEYPELEEDFFSAVERLRNSSKINKILQLGMKICGEMGEIKDYTHRNNLNTKRVSKFIPESILPIMKDYLINQILLGSYADSDYFYVRKEELKAEYWSKRKIIDNIILYQIQDIGHAIRHFYHDIEYGIFER